MIGMAKLPLALIGGLGLPEILLIAGLVVLLLGARQIQEFVLGLGEGIRGFRTSLRGDDETSETGKRDETSKSG